MTTALAMSRPATSSRMKRLRRRSVMRRGRGRLLRRRQDEQEPAVVIVGRKQISGSARGQISLGVDLDRLAERSNAPLQHGLHMIAPVFELQAEHVAHLPADDTLGVQ